MGATRIVRLQQVARVEMTRPRAFGRDRQRLHALAHEAQRFGKRTGEVAQRAQFADVFCECRPGPMVQRVAAGCAMFEERQDRVHDSLQRNRSVLGGRRNGVHQRREPGANVLRLLRPLVGVGAVVVRHIGVSGARLVALDQTRERHGVRGAPPSRIRPRQRARGLARGEPFLLIDVEIAGQEQAAEVARREVGFDPVAEADQRASRPRERGGKTGAKRDRPVVAQRFFPDEPDVRIRRAREFDLVERRPGGENAPEDLFDLRFATAGVEQVDACLRGRR